MVAAKRKYSSTHRTQQAAATRRLLLGAARVQFGRHGYAGTTIESIALDANVSVPTFYLTFGTKRAMLFALLDQIENEANPSGAIEALQAAAGNPHRQLEIYIEFAVRRFTQGADVLNAVRSAAGEPDLAAFWAAGEARRRAGQAPLLEDWASRGALRPGMSRDEGAATFWALTGPDLYRSFVADQAWSPEAFRAWLLDTLARLLFIKRWR